ncbi:ABC transporter substrate-binding protein [Cryobacterium sp. Y50]|uniref:ABC transporter substrate-binding protein n=1 Tax=Cryobacterium sp. Y50 TaxID=2048286 RepID=UPI001E5FF399|nr:ABC transporter substrate-binding protein [Cryobacterium sp. Y50]
MGHGAAAEEPFWLMTAGGSTSQYDGVWYDMELSPFRGTAERLTAYQAGGLDAIVISPQAQIIGTARGALDLYSISTIMREAEPDSFSTSAVVLEDSGISSLDDLKGAAIAIVDEGSQPDFIARQGLREADLDPATDAEFVVLPYPSQAEALHNGLIDVAVLPEPFYTLALSEGGVKPLFDAADLTDFAYDLLTISFDRKFVEDNIGAVCAWAADYAASMDAYIADPQAGKRVLVGSDFVTLPEDVYLRSTEYARPAGGVVDAEGTAQMMEAMIEFGVVEESDRIDVGTLIRDGVTLGH